MRYVYGPEGLLHAETTPGSTALGSVYIWLNGEPIGLIRSNTLYHVHSDHLGRPEVVTDASRNVVWRAAHYPWDRRVMTSSIGAYNLGFPGQYRDGETAQWYNYFRTYDGSIGRYTQADPIGLAGGSNTFSYALANPISLIDLDGAKAVCAGALAVSGLVTFYTIATLPDITDTPEAARLLEVTTRIQELNDNVRRARECGDESATRRALADVAREFSSLDAERVSLAADLGRPAISRAWDSALGKVGMSVGLLATMCLIF